MSRKRLCIRVGISGATDVFRGESSSGGGVGDVLSSGVYSECCGFQAGQNPRIAVPAPTCSVPNEVLPSLFFCSRALSPWLPSPDFSTGRSAPKSPLPSDGFQQNGLRALPPRAWAWRRSRVARTEKLMMRSRVCRSPPKAFSSLISLSTYLDGDRELSPSIHASTNHSNTASRAHSNTLRTAQRAGHRE